jgi:predicted AlkP superfamily phosphohydrolase/phosphomutase
MKLLIIGIDGAGDFLLNKTTMPFLTSLRDSNSAISLTEDLFSRGWAELFIGKHGSESGGLYQYPRLNGSFEFTPAFSCTDTSNHNQSINPLWTLLNSKGFSVGMQNLPTCYPAPQVNGFFISGGGGGKFSFSGIPTSLASSDEIRKILIKNNYVPDVMFRAPLKFGSLSNYINILKKATTTYVNNFIELSTTIKPDIGLFIEKLTVELFFLAYKNIIDYQSDIKNNSSQESGSQLIFEYMQYLDNLIKKIFETLQPKHFIIVSDHSTAPFAHEGNTDILLRDLGFLNEVNFSAKFLRRGTGLLKRHYNRTTSSLNINHSIKSKLTPITSFNKKQTKAFGTFYDSGNIAGIYLNDERFSGTVNTRNRDTILQQIMNNINSTPEVKKYNMMAVPYRDTYSSSAFEKRLPDIILEKPDDIYFSSRNRNLFIANKNNGVVSDDLSSCIYPNSGLKGRHPLLITDNHISSLVDSSDSNDLTLGYKLIDRLSDSSI